MEFDQTMALLTNPINGSEHALKGLQVLSSTIIPNYFARVLQSCNASAQFVSALTTAAPLLTNVQVTNDSSHHILISHLDLVLTLISCIHQRL